MRYQMFPIDGGQLLLSTVARVCHPVLGKTVIRAVR